MTLLNLRSTVGQWKERSSNLLLLPLLTAMYIVGELGHFLIGVVSRSVAQSIGYGDQSCLVVQRAAAVDIPTNVWDICKNSVTEASCILARAIPDSNGTNEIVIPCDWNYNGLGTDYQVLAGPSFIACFTTAGILWGIVADKVNRVYLLGIATIGCGFAITGTAFATEYWHLVLCRMALAVGAAACTPLAAVMLGDVFSEDKRALAMGIFNSGIFIGFGVSFAIGTYVKDTTIFEESWRTCFLVSGIPALIIAILFMLVIKEPRNGKPLPQTVEMLNEINVSTKENPSLLKTPFALITRPEVLLLLVAACIRHSAGYVWGYNSALYFQTYYPTYDSGWWLFGIPMVCGVFGCIFGGHLSDRLVNRLGISARVLVLAISQLVSVPFTAAIFYLDPPYAFVTLIFAFLTSEMWFGVMYATMVELVPGEFKSSVVAIALFIINNVGGILPVLVGPLTHVVGDYRTAILLMDPGALLTSSLLFFGCWGLLRRQEQRQM